MPPAFSVGQTTSQRCGVSRRRPVAPVAVLATPTSPSFQQGAVQSIRKTALITAVKTPYLRSGKFDLDAYDRHLENQVKAGVEGVIVGGTTGEGHLMSWDEHIMLIAHTVNSFGDKLKVIGNTGSNSTREALHATEQGFAVGMDAALQINPYYGKTSKAGLLMHFTACLQEGPGIIYNVPGRTGQDIPDDVIFELAQHPNFLGVKECTGNKRIANYTSKGVNCWSGNDDEAHAAKHESGAVGVISVAANLVPGLFSKMFHGPANYALANSVAELNSWLFCEPNPIALNTAMAMCGLSQPVFRLPYVPLERARREKGAKLLSVLQKEIPGCREVRVMEDHEFVLVGRVSSW